MPRRIEKPELKILFEEGVVSHEECVRTAALILNEMIHWDFSEPEKEDIYVSREVSIDNGQKIDILITGKTFACVIENKFGSKEQSAQCQNYKEFINKLGNEITKKYIYIDLDDRKYEKKKEAELKDYALVKYTEIRKIIQEFIQGFIEKNVISSENTKDILNILNQYIICLNDKYASDFDLDNELKNLANKLKDKLGLELRKNKANEPLSLIIKSEKTNDYQVDYVIDLYDGLIFKVCITFKSKKIEYPYRKILLNYEEFSKLLCGEQAVKEDGIKEFIDKYNSFKANEFDEIKKNVNEFIESIT